MFLNQRTKETGTHNPIHQVVDIGKKNKDVDDHDGGVVERWSPAGQLIFYHKILVAVLTKIELRDIKNCGTELRWAIIFKKNWRTWVYIGPHRNQLWLRRLSLKLLLYAVSSDLTLPS